ncbi:hypothetical protein PHMEG_00016715 [Phytophthora megakarya]|uniref:Uncharacterized protein n=1 Tax=Phytophthora megakarya TaxID=4795 RepID=A0A225VZ75_9STRA|nr:hypothetical protein PHMEG_00016715 [Phytophthora megakarya]
MGLQVYGSLPNTVVGLVKQSREELGVLSSDVVSMENQLRSVVGRVNEIETVFSETSERLMYQRSNNSFGYATCPAFSLKLFEYSEIGEGINVHCIPSKHTCYVDSGVELQRLDEEEVEDDYISEADISDEHDSIVTSHNANELGHGIGVDVDESDGEEYQRETVESAQTEENNPTDKVTGGRTMYSKARCGVLYSGKTVEMHHGGNMFVQPASGSNDCLSKILMAIFEVLHQFLPGWGVRPKRGSIHGAKYIGPFKNEAEDENKIRHEISKLKRKIHQKHPVRLDRKGTAGRLGYQVTKLLFWSYWYRKLHSGSSRCCSRVSSGLWVFGADGKPNQLSSKQDKE